MAASRGSTGCWRRRKGWTKKRYDQLEEKKKGTQEICLPSPACVPPRCVRPSSYTPPAHCYTVPTALPPSPPLAPLPGCAIIQAYASLTALGAVRYGTSGIGGLGGTGGALAMSLGMGMGIMGMGLGAYDGMGGHAMLPASRETSLNLMAGASDELYAYNAHLLDR